MKQGLFEAHPKKHEKTEKTKNDDAKMKSWKICVF